MFPEIEDSGDDEVPKEAEKQLQSMRNQRYKPDKNRHNINLLLNDAYHIIRANLKYIPIENKVAHMIDNYPWFRMDPVMVIII